MNQRNSHLRDDIDILYVSVEEQVSVYMCNGMVLFFYELLLCIAVDHSLPCLDRFMLFFVFGMVFVQL